MSKHLNPITSPAKQVPNYSFDSLLFYQPSRPVRHLSVPIHDDTLIDDTNYDPNFFGESYDRLPRTLTTI